MYFLLVGLYIRFAVKFYRSKST